MQPQQWASIRCRRWQQQAAATLALLLLLLQREALVAAWVVLVQEVVEGWVHTTWVLEEEEEQEEEEGWDPMGLWGGFHLVQQQQQGSWALEGLRVVRVQQRAPSTLLLWLLVQQQVVGVPTHRRLVLSMIHLLQQQRQLVWLARVLMVGPVSIPMQQQQ